MADMCEHDWLGSSCPECRVERREQALAADWLHSHRGVQHADEDHVKLLAAYGAFLSEKHDRHGSGVNQDSKVDLNVSIFWSDESERVLSINDDVVFGSFKPGIGYMAASIDVPAAVLYPQLPVPACCASNDKGDSVEADPIRSDLESTAHGG